MDPTAFRAHGHQLVDWIADYLATVESRRPSPDVRPGDTRRQLPGNGGGVDPKPFQRLRRGLSRRVLRRICG